LTGIISNLVSAPNVPEPELPHFEDSVMFAGGRLSLDFVNTFCMRRGAPVEFLWSAEALEKWLRSFASFTGKDLGPLDSPIHEELFTRALDLRTAIRNLVLGAIQNQEPSPKALRTLNQVIRANPTYPRLTQKGLVLTATATARTETERWLTEIAIDAADLLTNGDLKLVRQCEASTCIRVFYDTTKNHKRRWCVEKCGSRVKSAAYYERKKGVREFSEER